MWSTPVLFKLARLALSFLAVIVLSGPARADQAPDASYLSELIRKAGEARLADSREWHVLLHYRPNVLGGYTSEQDGPTFFLAPDGKTNPQAELDATLAGFFSDELIGEAKQPTQCAFVARYHWLRDKLAFDARRLPPLACKKFDAWMERLAPRSITVIFPSAFMNNPASMFGHTLLRVDRQGQTPQTRILAYTINFMAEVPDDEGMMFAVRGISGGYKGGFSVIPYYLKVREYRDIENRDIWEYRLNLTDAQVRRMLMHVWEMGIASFDYFFFKENCSYQLLPLLEVANPEWHFTERFTGWTIPGDTVRLLTAQPGLVGEVVYRPARTTQIRRRYQRLSGDERRVLGKVLRDPSLTGDPSFQQRPVERRTLMLDIASDYLRYQSITDEKQAETYKARDRKVLVTRSELKVKFDETPIEPFVTRPELGHRTSRMGIGAGYRQDEWFEEVNLRAAYHDLLDQEPGYAPGYQIELLSGALRHYEEAKQTRLERFTLANVMSLTPADALFLSPSWKVNVGMQTLRHNDCRYCTGGVANGGAGLTFETHLLKREYLFAFGELETTYSHAFQEKHRAGGGGTLGMMADLTNRWRLLASATYLRFPLGEKSDEVRWSVGQRYTLAKDAALRFEFNHRERRDNEALFTIHAYF
ncbi:MAG TPA: DUF4105 domain-containing protein [Nitrospiraceae bacterium]